MPFAVPLPAFLTSRRHLAAVGVGLGTVVLLATAAGSAPTPTGALAASTVAVVAAPAGSDRAPSAARPIRAGTTTPSATTPPATAGGPVPAGPAITALAEQGIPVVALQAYQQAAARERAKQPSCHLSWTLVAAIGAVESGHGTHGGARLYADGQDLPHVVGPVLDGTAGNAVVADTDHGVYDGDTVFDHAVGPMQFIPGTWTAHGVDANGDGRADPFNIVDAAATTGAYLCGYGVDLATDAGRTTAVFGYNHLDTYVATVLALDAAYAGRPVVTTSTSPAPAPAPVPTPAVPGPRAPGSPAPSTPAGPPAAPSPSSSPTCPTPDPAGSTTAPPSPTATPTPVPSGCPTPTGSPAPSSTAGAAAGTSTPTG